MGPERPHQIPNSSGYDGQWYHLVAHDPFRQQGTDRYLDEPGTRYQRILVPALAYVLALGRQEWIDRAYGAVILLFVFLGAWWLSLYAIGQGRHPAWGIVFLAVPTVIVAVNLMAIEVALASLTAGFLIYADKPGWRLYVVLAAAALTRDTGILLAGGFCLCCLTRLQLRRGVLFGTSVLPAMAWTYLMGTGSASHAVGMVVHEYPFLGLFMRFAYVTEFMGRWFGRVLDYAGWLGMLVALVVLLRIGCQKGGGPAEFTALLFGVMGFWIGNREFWFDPTGYVRPLAPIYVLLAAAWIRERSLWTLLPILLVNLRMVTRFAPEILGIVGVRLPN